MSELPQYSTDSASEMPEEIRISNDIDRVLNDIIETLCAELVPREQEYKMLSREINDTLAENFRLSFKFSNGSPQLQFLLYARIYDLLRTKYGDTEIVNASFRAQFEPQMLLLPHRHVFQKNVDVRTQDIWNACMSVIRSRNTISSITPTSEISINDIEDLRTNAAPSAILFAVTNLSIDSDLVYVENGRPRRTDEKSRYRSLLRDHAILKKPTGTPEMDYIMQEIGTIIKVVSDPARNIPEELELFFDTYYVAQQLRGEWEKRYGEPFFPEGIFDKMVTDENTGN